jgi:pantoate kinase
MTKEATMAIVPPEQEEAFVEALKKRLAAIKASPLLAAMLQSATGITDHTSLAAVLAKKDIRDAEKKE